MEDSRQSGGWVRKHARLFPQYLERFARPAVRGSPASQCTGLQQMPQDVLQLIVSKVGRDALGVNKLFTVMVVKGCQHARFFLGKQGRGLDITGMTVCDNLQEVGIVCPSNADEDDNSRFEDEDNIPQHTYDDEISQQLSVISMALVSCKRMRCLEIIKHWNTAVSMAGLHIPVLPELERFKISGYIDRHMANVVQQVLATARKLQSVTVHVSACGSDDDWLSATDLEAVMRADLPLTFWYCKLCWAPRLLPHLQSITSLVLCEHSWHALSDGKHGLLNVRKLFLYGVPSAERSLGFTLVKGFPNLRELFVLDMRIAVHDDSNLSELLSTSLLAGALEAATRASVRKIVALDVYLQWGEVRSTRAWVAWQDGLLILSVGDIRMSFEAPNSIEVSESQTTGTCPKHWLFQSWHRD